MGAMSRDIEIAVLHEALKGSHYPRLYGLSPMEWRVFLVLVQCQGRVMGTWDLISAVYFDRPDCDYPSRSLMRVRIHQMRAKLKKTAPHITIETVDNDGYRLSGISPIPRNESDRYEIPDYCELDPFPLIRVLTSLASNLPDPVTVKQDSHKLGTYHRNLSVLIGWLQEHKKQVEREQLFVQNGHGTHDLHNGYTEGTFSQKL